MAAHWQRAKQRRDLDAHPERITAALDGPMRRARAVVNSVCTLPVTLARARAVGFAEHELRVALRSVAGHHSPLAHVARGLLNKLQLWSRPALQR